MEVNARLDFIENDLFKSNAGLPERELYIDKPRQGYTPKGPSSLEMFLSSVGGCVGDYAKRYLDRHDVSFSKLAVSVTARLSKNFPLRLSDIVVNVDSDAELGDKREVFELFVKSCPVHNTLLHTKEITIKVKD
jgi:putative redox protein